MFLFSSFLFFFFFFLITYAKNQSHQCPLTIKNSMLYKMDMLTSLLINNSPQFTATILRVVLMTLSLKLVNFQYSHPMQRLRIEIKGHLKKVFVTFNIKCLWGGRRGGGGVSSIFCWKSMKTFDKKRSSPMPLILQ